MSTRVMSKHSQISPIWEEDKGDSIKLNINHIRCTWWIGPMRWTIKGDYSTSTLTRAIIGQGG